jgi:hemolysin activation/secretion protein
MLGTSGDLRGFDQNRFRAKSSLLFNLEYRYPIWDTWDAVLFLDEGQVFNDFSEIGFDNLHLGGGAGLRFMTRTGFLFRIEAGFSKEQMRVLFEMKPNF